MEVKAELANLERVNRRGKGMTAKMWKCAERTSVSSAWRRLKVSSSEGSWMFFNRNGSERAASLKQESVQKSLTTHVLQEIKNQIIVTVPSGLEMHSSHQEQLTAVLLWAQCQSCDSDAGERLTTILSMGAGNLKLRYYSLIWKPALKIWSVPKGLVPRKLGVVLGGGLGSSLPVHSIPCPNVLVRWKRGGFLQQTAEVIPAILGGLYFSGITPHMFTALFLLFLQRWCRYIDLFFPGRNMDFRWRNSQFQKEVGF